MTIVVVDTPLHHRIMRIAKTTLSHTQSGIEFLPDDALVDVGFSSLDLANLMLALEGDFNLMIPSSFLTPGNFRSVASITTMMRVIIPEAE